MGMMAFMSEGYIFNGTLYAWLVGLPLMELIVVWTPLSNSQTNKTMNVNIFLTDRQLIDHAMYV
jgi:hypothetical protein